LIELRLAANFKNKTKIYKVLTEKNFNKTCFADGAKSVVFFNDVEEDGGFKKSF